MDGKHSGMGIASFLVSLVIGVGVFFIILIAGVVKATNPESLPDESIGTALIGLFVIACLFVNLIGIGLGIAGLVQKNRKRIFSVLGTIINGIVLLGVGSLILIGIMAK
jgi:hypothetical protein